MGGLRRSWAEADSDLQRHGGELGGETKGRERLPLSWYDWVTVPNQISPFFSKGKIPFLTFI